ncbi:MAG: tyrosine-type recombinase/integrase [Christensenellaceae bacterium]|nr:tyrosine-type recombinase/integrase [Christensenellaceae bacterium]
MKSCGIHDKTTHDLRHTFSSNLYYLGVDAKRHQYLMGHSSIQQTYDTYTTLDMSVTKQDIIDIWGDFYTTY